MILADISEGDSPSGVESMVAEEALFFFRRGRSFRNGFLYLGELKSREFWSPEVTITFRAKPQRFLYAC